METQLKKTAQTLIESLCNNNDKNLIFDSWKSLVSLINRYYSYKEIPYCPEVPIAMFQYVMKYSSKRAEENAIRAITTFGVLMNGVNNGLPSEKVECLIRLSLLLSYYRKHFQNVINYDVFPITEPVVTEYMLETVKDYGNTNACFDAIKLYVKAIVNEYGIRNVMDSNLVMDFESDTVKFLEEFKNATYDKTQIPNGSVVLNECYERMDKVGKCPIYVQLPNNAEITNKTYCLIPDDISFNIDSFYLRETSSTMKEENLDARIDLSISDNCMIIKSNGFYRTFLHPDLSLPIREIYVKKVEQYIEFSFDVRISEWSNIDNVPMSMDIRFEHFKIKEIELTFVVGAKGYMRTLVLFGKC